jgi:omega-amidase
LRIGLVQMEIVDGEAGHNLEHATALVRAAAPADVYLLPELLSTGYAQDEWHTNATCHTPEACRALQRLSVERDAWIGTSLISLDDQRHLANRFWLFAPNRTAAVYDKGHLFAPLLEDRYLTPGTRRTQTTIHDWTVALSLCFDLRFPEMYRRDALEGSSLFLTVAAWPSSRAEALRVLARARAIENQAFLALCNRCGLAADGLEFGGGSALIAPDGSVVADAGAHETVVIAEADRQLLAAARVNGDVLALRREGLDW